MRIHFFLQVRWLLLAAFLLSLAEAHAQDYSWSRLNTAPYGGKQDDICFVDELQGWYVNGIGRIFHTRDGGASWEMQLEKKGTFFRCIAFLDSLTGFAGTIGTDYFPGVTDTIPLYRTTDGGRNWSPVAYEGSPVKGLCAIDVVREQIINSGRIDYRYHIYAVGRVGSPAAFIVSHDGGATFRSMDMSAYCGMLFDIRMFSKKEGFACAASGDDVATNHARILYTADGGASWKTVYESSRPYEISWKISFPTREVGYATLQHYNPDTSQRRQLFLKTTNGGRSWEEHLLCEDYQSRPFGVGFIDERSGFIGTMNTGYATGDGGKTWRKTDLGKACNKIRIVRSPEGRVYGYAIGVDVMKLQAP